MKDIEIWKEIPDFPGYEASSFGRIKSTRRIVYVCRKTNSYSYEIPERIMTPHIMNSGYYGITLCLNGKHINTIVHRLIAKTFIPNPYDFAEVNHKDENKLNNKVSNLEWCNKQYNKNYGTGNRRSAKKRSTPVVQYSLNGEFIKEYNSIIEASKCVNGDRKGIALCCKGVFSTAQGYIWRYKNERY